MPGEENMSEGAMKLLQTMKSSTKLVKLGSKWQPLPRPEVLPSQAPECLFSFYSLVMVKHKIFFLLRVVQKQYCFFIWVASYENFSFQMYTADCCLKRNILPEQCAGWLVYYTRFIHRKLFHELFKHSEKNVCISRNFQNKLSVVSKNTYRLFSPLSPPK